MKLHARLDNSARYPPPVFPPYLTQLLLHELVQDPVLLTDVVPHHGLPVRIMFPITARHGANIGFLGGKVCCYSVLEVDPGQMVLQVPVRVLGGGLPLADGADLDSVLSRITGDTMQGLPKSP